MRRLLFGMGLGLAVSLPASAQSPWLAEGAYAQGWLYHAATFESYGDTMPLEVRVDYPALADGEGEPPAAGEAFPLIVFEHAAGSWYDNYDYLFRLLATRGFVVISGCHDSCGSWGPWGGDEYRTKHADLFHASLDLMLAWNADPGSELFGTVDEERVSLAGHSHGGGAVLDALARYRPVDPAAPIAIRCAHLLAPCPWRIRISDYPATYPVVPPLSVVYGSADRDGCVADGQAIGIYEVGRRPRHYTHVDGADHYAFTDAGGMGASTITREQAQQAAASAIVAFYEHMLHGDAAALAALRGETPLLEGPPARSYQFHDPEHLAIDGADEASEESSVAIARVPGQAFVNGFLSDTFVDFEAGVALIRAQIADLLPALAGHDVLYYEDAARGVSAYDEALTREVLAGRIADPTSTSDPATFATLIGSRPWALIVAAHQDGSSSAVFPFDAPLAAWVCAGGRVILSDFRKDSASAAATLACAGTAYDGLTNWSTLTTTDPVAVHSMTNPGWGIYTYGLDTSAEVYATNELDRPGGDDPLTNSLGLPVLASGLTSFEEAWMDQPGRTLHYPSVGLELAWESVGAELTETLAAPGEALDARGWRAVSLRVAQLTGDPLNPPGETKDFSVELVDAAAERASLALSSAPQGALRDAFPTAAFGPKSVFETYRLPLADFVAANPALDLARLVSLVFRFDRSPTGRLVLDDIELATRVDCPAAPSEVERILVVKEPGGALGISWDEVPGVAGYRVARGSLGGFYDHTVDGALGAGGCEVTGTRFDDADDIGADGAFYYYVAPRELCGATGSWGRASGGLSRPDPTPSASCP